MSVMRWGWSNIIARIKSIVTPEYECHCTNGAETMQASEIDAVELKSLLDGESAPYLLDVREPDECAVAMIGGAVNIPVGDLGKRLNEVPKDRFVVAYCFSGMRSAHAAEFLRSKGYANAVSLKGGVKAWAREVDPSFPAY
jgi:sulfur-carrier protein adenylyltransferase/sulfurtransferase